MTLGQFVDFCIEWNELQGFTDEERPNGITQDDKPKIREATQADWDAFWG